MLRNRSRRRTQVFDFGVASRETGAAVNDSTLFEIGAVTKTFTATLASWAQVDGSLALSDAVGTHLPALKGTPFGDVTLLHLGTHTPGGLPLQVPADVTDEAQLMRYFADWQPTYAPGTQRTYSNPGIGTLGLITARSLGRDFTALVERRLLLALGMGGSFIEVPDEHQRDYAQGYAADDSPARMSAGVLSAETYGLKVTAADLIRFVEAQMGELRLDPQLQRAIADTHTGWFTAGPMTQDLIWEQYPYPVSRDALLAGNAPKMFLEANPVTALQPPLKPRPDVWINKTGSTRGFSAYVAFVPQERIGVVVLANKSFPVADRVVLGYRILSEVAVQGR